jgi:hypothetical protein
MKGGQKGMAKAVMNELFMKDGVVNTSYRRQSSYL